MAYLGTVMFPDTVFSGSGTSRTTGRCAVPIEFCVRASSRSPLARLARNQPNLSPEIARDENPADSFPASGNRGDDSRGRQSRSISRHPPRRGRGSRTVAGAWPGPGLHLGRGTHRRAGDLGDRKTAPLRSQMPDHRLHRRETIRVGGGSLPARRHACVDQAGPPARAQCAARPPVRRAVRRPPRRCRWRRPLEGQPPTRPPPPRRRWPARPSRSTSSATFPPCSRTRSTPRRCCTSFCCNSARS